MLKGFDRECFKTVKTGSVCEKRSSCIRNNTTKIPFTFLDIGAGHGLYHMFTFKHLQTTMRSALEKSECKKEFSTKAKYADTAILVPLSNPLQVKFFFLDKEPENKSQSKDEILGAAKTTAWRSDGSLTYADFACTKHSYELNGLSNSQSFSLEFITPSTLDRIPSNSVDFASSIGAYGWVFPVSIYTDLVGRVMRPPVDDMSGGYLVLDIRCKSAAVEQFGRVGLQCSLISARSKPWTLSCSKTRTSLKTSAATSVASSKISNVPKLQHLANRLPPCTEQDKSVHWLVPCEVASGSEITRRENYENVTKRIRSPGTGISDVGKVELWGDGQKECVVVSRES